MLNTHFHKTTSVQLDQFESHDNRLKMLELATQAGSQKNVLRRKGSDKSISRKDSNKSISRKDSDKCISRKGSNKSINRKDSNKSISRKDSDKSNKDIGD